MSLFIVFISVAVKENKNLYLNNSKKKISHWARSWSFRHHTLLFTTGRGRKCCFNIILLLFLLFRYDYLQITDGSSNTIGIYCGNQTGKSVRVVGTVAVLEFHTDGSVQGRGFELSFSFFPQPPGEFITFVIYFFTAAMYSCLPVEWSEISTGFVSRTQSHWEMNRLYHHINVIDNSDVEVV